MERKVRGINRRVSYIKDEGNERRKKEMNKLQWERWKEGREKEGIERVRERTSRLREGRREGEEGW